MPPLCQDVAPSLTQQRCPHHRRRWQAAGAATTLEAATIALEAAPPPQAEVMLPEQAEAATAGVSRLTGGTLHLFLQSSSWCAT